MIEKSIKSRKPKNLMKHLLLCFIALNASGFASAQSSWKVQYFHLADGDRLGNRSSEVLDLYANGQTVQDARAGHLRMDWGRGGPQNVLSSQPDFFGAKFQTTLAPGQYKISIVGDDGIRARFANETSYFIDSWGRSNQNRGEVGFDRPFLVSGTGRDIVVEYFEADGLASLEVSISRVNYGCANPWNAQIFDRYQNSLYRGELCSDSSNPYIFSRDWDVGSPLAGLPYDHFAIRLTKWLPAGNTYDVKFTADDGIKIITDNYDHTSGIYWRDGGNNSGDVRGLNGGRTLVVDYYEAGGLAKLNVEISLHQSNPTSPITQGCAADQVWRADHFDSSDFKNYSYSADGCGPDLFNTHANHVNGHSVIFSKNINRGMYRIFLKADDFAFLYDGIRGSANNEVTMVNAATSQHYEPLNRNDPSNEWDYKRMIESCLGDQGEAKLFIEYRDYPSSSGPNNAFMQIYLQRIGDC